MNKLNMRSIACLFLSLGWASICVGQIEPNWESMAENYRPPEWLQDGKIGVWTHWGVPSATDENRPNDGSHYGRRMYGTDGWAAGGQREMTRALTEFHTQRYGHPSEFGYEDLVPLFKAENWDPEGLVKFFKDNGARFIMPVACHHDNFDMYDSSHPWNSVDMGPKRDTLQEWKDAATKHGMKFGVSTHLYWSPRFFNNARQYQKKGTLAWKLFNMDYDPKGYANQESWNRHWFERCWEIIDKYDPDMFNNDSPYPADKFGEVSGVKLFSDFINRDLKENGGKQTTVLSFKNSNMNRKAFTYNLERGSAADIKPEPWMWATDLSGGWYYRKGAVNPMSIPVMVGNAVDAISKNGVVMLNVALRGDGTLPENQAAYLTTFGAFLKTCGEGIYGTRPWKVFGEGPLKMKDGRQGENKASFSQNDIRFTTKGDTLYAFVLAKPTADIVIKTLGQGGLYEEEIGAIRLLGSDEKLTWTRNGEALTIQLPKTLPDQPVTGFRISPAPKAKSVDHYPPFRWDTIPLYMHMRKSVAFTPEEIDYLATFPIVTLEKTTGSKTYGSSEAGSREAAKAIKAVNPETKVLYYRNVMCNYGSYNVNDGLRDIPNAFLVARNGNKKLHRGVREVYDLSDPTLRKWWVDHCVEMAGHDEIDGIFLDGNIKALEPAFLGSELGAQRKQEVADGYAVMMKDLQDRTPPNKMLIANIIRARLTDSGLNYMQYFDGSYLEGIESEAGGFTRLEYLARGIDAVQQAARQGKIICMSMGLGNAASGGLRIDDSRKKLSQGADTRPRLEYCLALFLICAEKYSYVYPHDGYSANNNDSSVWLKRFAEYDKPLGPPKGPAVQDGYTYTREFKHASVFLDIEKKQGRITWKDVETP
ncbi:Alpha-L-fucosidase [Novipirellula aureliae]|uniref:alpha-L-fucosidase n=1 Tax=Novipirellula aureliae TaxID=2527966 RepID=A0A5C6E5X0_9BACT|nr:alpha-L-fucosidase [Novipirellula aureliae]TWU44312.1 Alpha-L-fucosidase [Novipirellula aureliae]